MGQHSFKAGNLFLQTDKPYYCAGDTVTGQVYADFTSVFPGDKIYLKVKGYEKCEWIEKQTIWEDVRQEDGTTQRVAKEHYEEYEGKNSFYSHKFCLNTWGMGNIGIGQYQFPFSFVLQSNLPGSFEEEGQCNQHDTKEKYKAKIIYKIKAETSTPSGWDKMKCKQELVVREPLRIQQSEQQGQMEKDVTTWCCISQGKSKIKCYFENNNYLPGERANVITEVDNSECSADIEQIQGKLIKVIDLQCKKKSIKIQKCLNESHFGSIDAGKSKKGEEALRTPLELISYGKPMQPTTCGNLVSCKYYLSIISDMKGVTCCSEDPNVTVPIQIMAPPPPNYGEMKTPEGWQPQVFENHTFAFTSGDMYAKGDVSVNMNINVGGMNQPPQMGAQTQMNVPPQQQFNQPPQAQMSIEMNQQQNQPPNPYPTQQDGQAQVQMNVGFNQPPVEQNQGFNQPPIGQQNDAAQVQMNVGFNQPPVEQNQGFNQPPVEQNQGFNQPPVGQQNVAQVQMNVGFNQPPVEQNQGFNQPPIGQQNDAAQVQMNVGFNQPPVYQNDQGFNQPPIGQVQMNMNMTDNSAAGGNMEINMTMDANDTSRPLNQ